MQDRWWIWAAVFFVFIAFKAVRGALRAAGGKPADGMARMNAAAERILKARGATASNPLPRTKANSMGSKPSRAQTAAAKPRNNPAIPKAGSTPAVVRRGIREPVIQRRR